MRTTTVIWRLPNDPQTATAEDEARYQANRARLLDAAAALAGELYRNDLHSEFNEDKTILTVKRGWPDLAAAEAWVALCIAESENTLNGNLVSAQVDPE